MTTLPKPSRTPAAPVLSIIIPAHNEEAAIAETVERTLAARPRLVAAAGLAGVEVIVVDDGSRDRTAERAARFPEVRLLRVPERSGYGAAIKRGFAAARGELLGFLDADGTCDPEFFAELCIALDRSGADVASGSRLGAGTGMPALRRLGNRFFAVLLRLVGAGRITDSASGMRVVRRSAWPRLLPLPDGMHFTPAMSSLALFDPALRLVELPMPYHERTGRSKLHPVRDGLRFLASILDTALTYRPLRLLGAAGVVLLLAGAGYGYYPVRFYLAERRLEEWMIYRLVAVLVAVTCGVALLAVGAIGQQTVAVIHGRVEPRRGLRRALFDFLIPWGILAIAAGVALNWSSLLEYARQGTVSAHWSYVLAGGLLVTVGVQLVAFGVLARIVNLLAARRAASEPDAPEPP
jgi:glycosyltransferase involved in cell wall biosynthesis